MNKHSELTILFIGDVFGEPGIRSVRDFLPLLKKKYNYDFVIAQCENVSGRKGIRHNDYLKLKKLGVNAFTFGNHVWAKEEIFNFIDNEDMIRPLNIENHYPGKGSRVFRVKNFKLRVTSLMGLTFNKLLSPWKEEYANNFFDAIDPFLENPTDDFHFIDFHAETTSEKNVLGLYLDGKVSAVVGTHTHVQTNDARILPKGTCYISDAGMTGPKNAAIGANFEEVYNKMRFNSSDKFKVSKNNSSFNGVIVKLNRNMKNEIIIVNE
ncbi:TIGR00282 family metallophosphoesterase [[Mycoplasma] mobile]|uniref:Expressed protein n=1 Tax=Mycoplasma mobile (strain ATCC 43663 / 163K / NCTC 11711) TaxID=267748 RepID=Q6KHD0_MYCM1|nr:TIGR00282 family metallophosphoesterase [[Mycoplasma] mobile]AAT28000.1 expressed protein [Mycoplasma mobile 163K]